MSVRDSLHPLTDPFDAEIVGCVPSLSEARPDFPLAALFRHSSSENMIKNPTIMIVDDEPVNAKLIRKCLSVEGYREFIVVTDATEALDAVTAQQPDILLLDIMMPRVSGLEILAQVRGNKRLLDLPVIIVTAATDNETKMTALKLGATDFLTKPIDQAELVLCVRNVLAAKAYHDSLKRYSWELEIERPVLITEMETLKSELVIAFAQAVESRAGSADGHVARVGRIAGLIAARLGLGDGICAMIEQAAPLHDIGKIAIPDAVLSAAALMESQDIPGMPTEEPADGRSSPTVSEQQQKTLQKHAELGAKILADARSPLLQMAGRIALAHHERWDGKGYPLGLAAEEIPLEGRITSVAHSFDLISSAASSRPGGSLGFDRQILLMSRQRGLGFDPEVIDALAACQEDLQTVR
jgi:putative two-component system response regulator